MNTNRHPLISTSALAKQLEIAPRNLFELLVDKGWIERHGKQWKLTGKGQFEGGDYVNSQKYGEYIGWPESILEHKIFSELFKRPLRTRVIAADIGLSAHRLNAILAERGWQRRFHRGWVLTEEGKKIGGIESEDDEVGVPFTLWPRAILDNPWLLRVLDAHRQTINAIASDNNASSNANDEKQLQSELNLEGSGIQSYRFSTLDGREVNCREDQLVCDWLYTMGVTHSYRYALENGDLGYADFYVPQQQVFIEVWHRETNNVDLKKKLARIDYYRKNARNLIEIEEEIIFKLDHELPKALLKYGITVF